MKWLVALAALGALAAAGYAGVKRKPAATAPSAQAVVEFTQQDLYIVEPLAMERTLPLTGSLAPFAEATVKAKVAGELVAVTVREGETVKQGQVLARIDQTEVQARVAARRADVGAARAQLDWAAKNRASQKALLEKGFIAQTAFDNVQSNYDVALARLRAAEAELVLAQKSLGDSVLVAPFAGIVSLRHAQAGERVALDGKVVTVVDLSRLQLEAAVPATEIGKLRVGQPVAFRVDGFGEQRFAGRIDRINPATVAGSRSIYVYAVIDNPQAVLRAGLFAQGAVSLERIEGALVVPASAVREELGRNIVYALVDGKVQRRAVKVGPADAIDRVQVLEGLAPGDRIVRANLGTLREGTAARLAGPQPEASR
ncbi:MAG TPA: efflux RND transporter periplasmic adaptor subunit [Burkholderiales bacterium]|nr:efflux RND transporter periplasmic adaptor subunit [Burkholderiales bacterium]